MKYFKNKYCYIDEKITKICKSEYPYFFAKQNVECIGLGYKEVRGICTYQKCIKVFVKNKLPKFNLNLQQSIPSLYKGIRTDIVESGAFHLCSLVKKIRPALGGYSVGPFGVKVAGTLGCLVKDNKSDNYYILSNNHILANVNNIQIGTPIVQPSTFDKEHGHNKIAELSRYVPIKFKGFFTTPVNYMDAAIAKVSKLSLVSPNIALIDQAPDGISKPLLGETVYKVGRTTELTAGSVDSINATTIQRYPQGDALFKNQIVTSGKMADVGDSGAILLNYNLEAIGMLMSCSYDRKYTKFNDIHDILKEFDVQIVSIIGLSKSSR